MPAEENSCLTQNLSSRRDIKYSGVNINASGCNLWLWIGKEDIVVPKVYSQVKKKIKGGCHEIKRWFRNKFPAHEEINVPIQVSDNDSTTLLNVCDCLLAEEPGRDELSEKNNRQSVVETSDRGNSKPVIEQTFDRSNRIAVAEETCDSRFVADNNDNIPSYQRNKFDSIPSANLFKGSFSTDNDTDEKYIDSNDVNDRECTGVKQCLPLQEDLQLCCDYENSSHLTLDRLKPAEECTSNNQDEVGNVESQDSVHTVCEKSLSNFPRLQKTRKKSNCPHGETSSLDRSFDPISDFPNDDSPPSSISYYSIHRAYRPRRRKGSHKPNISPRKESSDIKQFTSNPQDSGLGSSVEFQSWCMNDVESEVIKRPTMEKRTKSSDSLRHIRKSYSFKTLFEQFFKNHRREKVKSIVRELRIDHRYLPLTDNFGLGSYFDRLNNGPPPSQQEQMRYEWLRLASFQHYTGAGNAINLARNGFYHQPTDGPTSTRCVYCDETCGSWQYFDDVAAVHRRLSPNCPFHTDHSEESLNVSINCDDPGSTVNQNSDSGSSRSENIDVTNTSTTSSTSTLKPTMALTSDVDDFNRELEVTHVSQAKPNNTNVESVPQQPTEVPEGRQRSIDQQRRTGDNVSGLPRTSTPQTSVPLNQDTSPLNNVKHPEHRTMAQRVNSFEGFPEYLDQTAEQMALAGFYFVGVADFTRCFCCGGGLRNWEAGDDPLLEHTRWFPRCGYVLRLKGERYVAAVQRRHQEHMAEQRRQQIELANRRDANRNAPDPMTTDAASVMREMGYADQRIRDTILAARRQIGTHLMTTQQVLSWLLDQDDAATTTDASRQSGTKRSGEKDNGKGNIKPGQTTGAVTAGAAAGGAGAFASCDPGDETHGTENQNIQAYHQSTNDVPVCLLEIALYINVIQASANGGVELAQTETAEGNSRLVTNDERDTNLTHQRNLPIIDVFTRTVWLHPGVFGLIGWYAYMYRHWNNSVDMFRCVHGQNCPRCPSIIQRLHGAPVREMLNDQNANTNANVSPNEESQASANAPLSVSEHQRLDHTLTHADRPVSGASNQSGTKRRSKKKKKKPGQAAVAARANGGPGANGDARANGGAGASGGAGANADAGAYGGDGATCDPEKANNLLSENEKLQDMQTCKICMERIVNTWLLPCGHLVCCDICATRLRDCPACKKKIKGTVKTFMS